MVLADLKPGHAFEGDFTGWTWAVLRNPLMGSPGGCERPIDRRHARKTARAAALPSSHLARTTMPYGLEVVVSEMLEETVALLQIKAKVRTTLELRPLIRRGLPLKSLESLARQMDMPTLATAEVIGLVKRTVARRIQQKQTLDPEQSERLVRLARVLAQATAILGSLEKARRWLQKPNRALGGEPPIAILDTDVGAQAVLDELGRIDYGVFA